jgi:hypothetical protein
VGRRSSSTTAYLRADQAEDLAALSAATGRPQAEWIRRAVDLVLAAAARGEDTAALAAEARFRVRLGREMAEPFEPGARNG